MGIINEMVKNKILDDKKVELLLISVLVIIVYNVFFDCSFFLKWYLFLFN